MKDEDRVDTKTAENDKSVDVLEEAEDAEDKGGEQPAATASKKKKKKKKPAGTNLQLNNLPPQDNSRFRLLGDWPEVNETRQTQPPETPVSQVFTKKSMPNGQILQYGGENSYRTTKGELRELERIHSEDYHSIRKAAEVHRQTRKYLQSIAQPGMKMVDLCEALEKKGMQLVQAQGLQAGRGFPTGCSINRCAAHYTPNPGDETKLGSKDIVKWDFGIHVKGHIVDCAFSMAFDPMFDDLIKATQDGTNVGIQMAGIDARFSEIGAAIEEAINSYEMEVDGQMLPLKPIRNLNSHTIQPYVIHGGKSMPIVKTADPTRMEEGEVFAIETFATTGRGWVEEEGECSHYMADPDRGFVNLRLKTYRELLGVINEHFGTLPFCRRWLAELGETRWGALGYLVDQGLVKSYPPLKDAKGSYTSQMEHTIILRPTCKEVVTRGTDY